MELSLSLKFILEQGKQEKDGGGPADSELHPVGEKLPDVSDVAWKADPG